MFEVTLVVGFFQNNLGFHLSATWADIRGSKFGNWWIFFQFLNPNKIFGVAGFEKKFFSRSPHRPTSGKVNHFWMCTYHSFWYIRDFWGQRRDLGIFKNTSNHICGFVDGNFCHRPKIFRPQKTWGISVHFRIFRFAVRQKLAEIS